MRIPRIYLADELRANGSYQLDEQASQHVQRVLRLKPGDAVILFDGRGIEATAQIESSSGKRTQVHVTDQPHQTDRSPVHIHLGLAMSKGDRMDYAIQKSVEAGVSEITPLSTERTVVKLDNKRQASKHKHWQGIIISACEQCGQNYLPTLNDVMTLNDWAQQSTSAVNVVFDVEAEQSLSQLSAADSFRVAVGPEGGFSDAELTMLEQHDFTRTKLGPRVLRAETAAVAACVAIQVMWGDYAR